MHLFLMQYMKKIPSCKMSQKSKLREANNEQNTYIPLLPAESSKLNNSSYS